MPARATRLVSYTGVRPEVLERIGSDRRNVLDVGCANGALGSAVKERQGATVTGVDVVADLAAQAKLVLDQVVIGDADDWSSIAGQLTLGPYDCIVCADVLEHLRNPWAALRSIVELLTPDGELVISLPNVGHVNTLLNVFVLRRFPRRERGIHDDTHLRWFARRDVAELATQAGLTVTSWHRVMRILERPSPRNRVARFVALPGLRDLLTYQYVVVARRTVS
jgi:2-polyprenyl-3-methyl-5-hydroxy-6-metoxy-1,4-benzoquinol methylase